VYYQVNPERSQVIMGSREMLENKAYSPDHPGRKIYGTLPYFTHRDQIVARFNREARYFSKHYDPRADRHLRGSIYAEGAIFFEMKFGRPLSRLAEAVLGHYPDLKKRGRDICVFGLSGAGKSLVLEAVRQQLGKNAVIIDNDTARYNLFAKLVLDCEAQAGVNEAEVRKNLMHNAISAPLYFMLNDVAAELSARGYDVVRSSVMPSDNVDRLIYVEHPDGIDPRQITDEQTPEAVRVLYKRTHARAPEGDTYDWRHAHTETDFRRMTEVSVDVPKFAHTTLLKNLRAALAVQGGPSVEYIKNELCPDSDERRRRIAEQIRGLRI
jgi:predicted kinase